MSGRWLYLTLASVVVALSAQQAPAQSVAEFYRGKTITCYIGYGVGGGYDLLARTISKHMSRHIPGNPTILPQNMPGASSMILANHLAKRAPKDGTVFGAVNSALVFDRLFAGDTSQAQFIGPDMTMIGNAVSSASVLVAWHAAGIKTIDDIRKKPLIIGAVSRTGDTYLMPLAVKNVLGLDNLKIILGYPGTREAAIALERGEITGRVWDIEGVKATRSQWLTDGSLVIVAQFAPRKMPEVPADVPLVKDYVTSADDKTVLDIVFTSTILARPYIAPPDVPADRKQALRDAFMATMKDPAFLADTKKLQLAIDPTSGADMERVVADAYGLSPALIERVRSVLRD